MSQLSRVQPDKENSGWTDLDQSLEVPPYAAANQLPADGELPHATRRSRLAARLVGRGWIVVLAFGIVAIGCYYAMPTAGVASAVLICVVTFFAAASAIAAGVRAHGLSRLVWLAIGVGIAFSTVANVLTYISLSFASALDVLWLAAYVCYIIALFALGRLHQRADSRGRVLDTTILIIGGGVVMWVFLVAPALYVDGLTPTDHLLSVLFPVSDLVVFAMLVKFAVGAERNVPVVLLISGVTTLLTADCLYSYQLAHGTYHVGGSIEALWMLTDVLIAAASWHPVARAFPRSTKPVGYQMTSGRLLFLSAALLIGPMLLLIRPQDVTVLAITSAASFVLVMARMTLVNRGLRGAQAQLLETAHQAGMAEIATNVLHNVGNVLNSVNVSANIVNQKVRGSKLPGLNKAVTLMQQHNTDLGDYVTTDPRGKQLPAYLKQLSTTLTTEHDSVIEDLVRLTTGVSHIKEIVKAQQTFAGISGLIESAPISDLIEDALRISGATTDTNLTIIRDYPDNITIPLDRHRTLLILLNLITNAQTAMATTNNPTLHIHIHTTTSQNLTITIADSGSGIPPENLDQVFVHGFTTHTTGHGFGLHSSAIAATEMGGTLTVHNGPDNTGAVFTLQIPPPNRKAATS